MGIVQINVSETVAPTPSTLQSSGAIISQGGTTLTPGTSSLLTGIAALTALMPSVLALSSLTWSGGTAVANTSAAIPGLQVGDVFVTTIAGVSPAAWNATYKVVVTGTNAFSFSLAANPGNVTVQGTYTQPNFGELLQMATTFFAQGGSQAVWVLELGSGDGTSGPAALTTWINANPGVYYSYLVPRFWDATSGLLALIAANEALTAKTYFFVTTTLGTYTTYTDTMKCVVAMVESPNVPITEFSLAAAFQHSLAYAPSSSNRMTSFAFSFLFGVTPYPTSGNAATLAALKSGFINYVGTGAEGGISNTILLQGVTADGNDFSYWFSADWVQINIDLSVANAVINGSNTPLNPLYYNQPGINTLQDVAVQTIQNAVTFGLANGTVARANLDGPAFQAALDAGTYADENVVNAVPFIIYTSENSDAYAEGVYGGFSVVYIPQRPFERIIFNINVTNFLTQ